MRIVSHFPQPRPRASKYLERESMYALIADCYFYIKGISISSRRRIIILVHKCGEHCRKSRYSVYLPKVMMRRILL